MGLALHRRRRVSARYPSRVDKRRYRSSPGPSPRGRPTRAKGATAGCRSIDSTVPLPIAYSCDVKRGGASWDDRRQRTRSQNSKARRSAVIGARPLPPADGVKRVHHHEAIVFGGDPYCILRQKASTACRLAALGITWAAHAKPCRPWMASAYFV